MASLAISSSPSLEREVVILKDRNKADWDQFVREDSTVIAWHGYDWAELLHRYHETEFYPLAVYEGARICGILPLYRVRTFRTESLISVPYFVAGGVAARDADVQQALVRKAIEVANNLKLTRITLKQYKYKLNGPLVTDENYYNRELSISPDLNHVWQSISGFNRAKIEESRALDTKLEYPSTDLSGFYKLLLHDQHSHGVPCVGKSWIRELYNTGLYEIALLRHKGSIVSGTMAKKFRHTVSFPFTCLSGKDEHAQLFAYSLYWQLIERLAMQSITIVHSGRIPKTDAAAAYRLGWGGTKYDYYYQYHGLSTAKTEFSTKRGGRRAKLESLWKRVPTPLARLAGRIVTKQFP